MKNKKVLIMGITIISFIMAISNYKGLMVDGNQIVPLLFTLLGLAVTAYTFIYSPIRDILTKGEVNKEKLSKLLQEFENNILFVFRVAIVIILFDFCNQFDFPLLKNPTNLDLGIFKIESLKMVICNFIIGLLSSLSFLSLYDLFKGTFKILSFCLNIKK